jgi:thiol-disulfide isomerase/thioredoxin
VHLPHVFFLTTTIATALPAQSVDALARERLAFSDWLRTAPVSPLAAIVRQPIGAGLRLGPAGADVPLSGVAEYRLVEMDGRVTIRGPEGARSIPRGARTRLGEYIVTVDGPPGRAVVTAFGPSRKAYTTDYYPFNGGFVFTGKLIPPSQSAVVRVLGLDGIEVEAVEAGSVLVPMGQRTTRLKVRRLPTGGEESELEIFFRDSTNGRDTYPAGRFVPLIPAGGDRYRLDFNRARNPFCAYSSAYPCPAPWEGNVLRAPVTAGERYSGGGLEVSATNGSIAAAAGKAAPRSPAGSWRAALDLAGGALPFGVELEKLADWRGRLCNGSDCQRFSGVRVSGDSVILEMADYAATITATFAGDSLIGSYQNVGNRGPRVIPFHAARGRWPVARGSDALVGRWDATFFQEMGTSPRVIELRNGDGGLEGTLISNTGDYGHFAGAVAGESLTLSHFDGSFVYLITAALRGDTLRGVFHAGLQTETSFEAVRSTGKPHLKAPTEVTGADTTTPFRFAAPDLNGRLVSEKDPRFRGKVVVVDIFGSWCPTCHESAPVLVNLYRKYHARGLEVVGLAYEVTGDTAVDGKQVRRYREKFGIPFPLLLAGINNVESAAETLPQLRGFTSFPTTVFLARDGRVRRVHAGFFGAATGAQHRQLIEGFEREIEKLLGERRREKRERAGGN